MTQIQVIGIGLEGAQGLSAEALKKVEQAHILVGSSRQLAYFPDHPAERWTLGNLTTLLERLRSMVDPPPPLNPAPLSSPPVPQSAPQNIVILTSGDPLFFGFGRLLLEALPPDCLSFYPHLSSVQLAFSRLKLPWQDACVVSIHGRSWDALIAALKQGKDKIAVITDPQYSPDAIATLIEDLVLPCAYQLWICENLGGANERIRRFSIPATARSRASQTLPGGGLSDGEGDLPLHVDPLHLVILIRQRLVGPDRQEMQPPDVIFPHGHQSLGPITPILGIADSNFASFPDRPGLMTKREIRTMVLAELNLQPQQIIWDIGAGTGSVSIEIARLVPTSQIYAIEKTAIGMRLIHQNCERFGVNNVNPIHGTAPAILQPLPSPDRVFIGGSGGHLSALLTHFHECLKPDGQIVVAIATVESLSELITWTQSHSGWTYQLLQINISRSVTVGRQHRFSPLNPVTIATIKPYKK